MPRDHFTSGGKRIAVDRVIPGGAGPHPAVVVLHGSGGMPRGVDEYAQKGAALGYAGFLVHYFDRTGTGWASPATIRENFAAWMETLQDSLRYVRSQPEVDAARVALLGFSLGGYLALSLGTQDRELACIVDIFGGMPEHFAPHAGNLPPTLILHGEADPVVPVEESYRLAELLKTAGVPHELKTYRGQGHSFSGLAALDALTRTLGFLKKNLRRRAA